MLNNFKIKLTSIQNFKKFIKNILSVFKFTINFRDLEIQIVEPSNF